ncbi:MAG: hypothetical protein JSS07_05840, partial [Proteobacteria bacterium]|nr:hypothetical protein [Pseudomonadota bacterium]
AIEYIDLDDLKLKSKEGKPLFWLLAQIAYHGEEALFKKMWDIHKDSLTIDHFRMTCENSGESALWLLGATNQIENIWERFENLITLKDLRNTPIGPLSDISLLNRIKTQPTVFSMAWKKFAKQITANDLLLGATKMSDNSVLYYLLASSNYNNNKFALNSFQQIPNLFISPESHAYDLILHNNFLSSLLKSLVGFKSYFYKCLFKVKSKFKPSHSMDSAELERLNHDTDFKNLITSDAILALKHDYFNTFYDIGKMLEELGAHELAFEAYAKVPDSSFYKDEVYEKLALYWHGKALNSPLSNAFQHACLEKALSWALKCPQDIRQHCIKRIALTCILDNYSPDYQQPVSENLLALIGDHTTPQWCLEQFEQIKQTQLLEKKCLQQKEEIKELENVLKEQSQKLATLKKSPKIALDDNDLTLNIKNILTQTKKTLSTNTISSNQSDFSSKAVLTLFRATPGASTPLDKPLSKEEETLTQPTFSPSRDMTCGADINSSNSSAVSAYNELNAEIQSFFNGNNAQQLIDRFTLDDLRVASQGSDKNQTILWTLAHLAVYCDDLKIEKLFEKFKDELTIDDLRTTGISLQFGKASVLWLITIRAIRLNNRKNDDTKVFYEFWNKFKEQITIEDLRVFPEKAETSLLGLLAQFYYYNFYIDEENSTTIFFTHAWYKFKKEITANDFLRGKIEGSDHYHTSVLYFLYDNQHFSDNVPVDTHMLQECYSQIPDIYLSEDSFLYKRISNFEKKIIPLVNARNQFYLTLTHFKSSEDMNKADFDLLIEHANIALDKGYLNAFYEVGKMFEAKGKLTTALESYAYVPKNSQYYADIAEKLVYDFCEQALDATSDEAQKICYKKALDFALACSKSIAMPLIYTIAMHYIFGKSATTLDTPQTELESLIEGFGENPPVESCFAQLDQLKQKYELEKQCKQQEHQIAELKSMLKQQKQEIAELKKSKHQNLMDNLTELLTQAEKLKTSGELTRNYNNITPSYEMAIQQPPSTLQEKSEVKYTSDRTLNN